SVDNVVAQLAHGGQHAADRLDRGAGQGDVVAHGIHVAALAAEVGLHVDDDERSVGRAQVAAVGPGVRVGLYVFAVHACSSQTCFAHPVLSGKGAQYSVLSTRYSVLDVPFSPEYRE